MKISAGLVMILCGFILWIVSENLEYYAWQSNHDPGYIEVQILPDGSATVSEEGYIPPSVTYDVVFVPSSRTRECLLHSNGTDVECDSCWGVK